MIRYIKNTIALFTISMLFVNCQDVIDVKLSDGSTLLVIDAWINNLDEPQVIKLNLATPYFDSSPQPAINDAIVTIKDNLGAEFVFTEDGNTGNYYYEDMSGNGFGTIGNTYTLSVNIDGVIYTSETNMGRVPVVDSIVFEDYEPTFGDDPIVDGFEGQFYAKDFVGEDDAYWIKTYKNGKYLNKPQELNYSYDAGFEVDGVTFIEPIRSGINREPDDDDDSEDSDKYPPYLSGDSVRVEIHSISVDAFWFLNEAWTQMTLGDNTIFAPPLVNVPTNIETPEGAIPAVGFFNVGAVEALEVVVP